MNNKTLLMGVFAALLTLGGCATAPKTELSTQEMAQYQAMNPETMVNDAKARLVKAQGDGLQEFAPAHYQNAAKYLKNASDLLSDKAKKAKIIPYVAAADQALKDGYAAKDRATSALADVIKSRKGLQELNANKSHAREYEKLDERYHDLIATIEKADMEKAQKEAPILEGDMEALRIRITKQNVLGAAKKLLAKLIDKDGKDYAPNAITDAQTAYAKAEAFIQTHTDDKAGVIEAGHDAMAMVRRAGHFIDRVKQLHDKSYKELEGIVRDEESWLKKIDGALGSKPHPELAFGDRAARQAEEVGALASKAGEADKAVAAAQAKVSKLEASSLGNNQTIDKLVQENSDLKTQVQAQATQIATLQGQVKVLKETLQPGAKSPTETAPAKTEPAATPEKSEPAPAAKPAPKTESKTAPAAKPATKAEDKTAPTPEAAPSEPAKPTAGDTTKPKAEAAPSTPAN